MRFQLACLFTGARRYILGFCLASSVVLVPLPGHTQSETDEQNFLWQVNSPTNTVYLLGSIHYLSEASYPLPAVMETAFAEAEVLVLEADVGSTPEAELETGLVLLQRAAPEPGETLGEVLSPETYGLAAQQAQALGLPLEVFQAYEPWFLAVSMTAVKLISLGFTPEYGVDQYFQQQAQTADKPVLFLETVAQQADLFEQLSVDEQRQFMQQTLAELDQTEASINAIVAAWSRGDTEAMAAILLESFENYPRMEQVFLRDRNRDWLSQIQNFLGDDEDYLVVVGALHLVGPDSLIELLEQQGYEAEQL